MPRNTTTVQKKTKASANKTKGQTKKGKGSAYNAYMTTKLAELKKADPALQHSAAYQKAFDQWKAEQKGKAPK
ncbi:hypothetical protein JCM10450v2_002897 [Rhodotorula kratochvilovae]